MNSLKSLPPKSQLDQYNPNQQVNFELTHDGESYEHNSVYITGSLNIVTTGLVDNKIFYDNITGVSAFFENFNTECNLFQENITSYSRLNKMMSVVKYSPDQLCSGLTNTSEMRLPHLSHTPVLLVNSGPNTPFSFCHFPVIALNNMSGDMDSAKSGKIKVSFKLPPSVTVFFGEDSALVTSYYMTDLELSYKTVPSPSPSVSVRITEDTQKEIETSNTTIGNTFLNPLDSVLVSFSTVDSQTEQTQNSLICVRPPINSMSWQYRDQSNSLVTYEIESVEEQILSGLYVLNTMNCVSDLRDRLIYTTQDATNNVSDKFILGLKIGQLTDFSQNGLGLNVRIDNLTENYYAFMFGFSTKVLY